MDDELGLGPPRESYVPISDGALYVRQIGHGRPLVILHGGPDFDHTYLLPDMDRLAAGFRLVYYDQRGRGRSRGEVRLDTLSIDDYLDDLDRLLDHLGLSAAALLGHSWGGHLAMHYGVRRPARVSHLVLLNTAPAAYEDTLLVRHERARRAAPHAERLKALAESAAFAAGDPATVSEYCRILFSTTVRPENLDRLNLSWAQDDILRGRAIEYRLEQTGLFWSEGFSLLPALRQFARPTLIVHGDDDFIPVPVAEHIAAAIPGARLVVLPDCGHFSYLDCPEGVRRALADFFAQPAPGPSGAPPAA